MKRVVKKVANKVVPGLVSSVHQVRRIEAEVSQMRQQLNELQQAVVAYDDRLARLRQLASKVEPYQPAYGISGVVDAPLRASRERCLAIESWLKPMPGKRILDIGSSLGYFSFYFADRGAVVQGWEENVQNAEVARLISDINGIKVDFRTKEFNLETVGSINQGDFDAVFILSVFHHIVRFTGLEATQQLVKELMERVPVLVVELAKKGEDPSLPWDKSQPEDELAIFDLIKDKIEIKKLGDFGNHLSKKTRPLYVVQMKKQVPVNVHKYAYNEVNAEAYKDSPVAHHGVHRRYYFADKYIVKEYSFDAHSKAENTAQILNEIKVFLDIERGGMKVHHAPKMIDFEINHPVGAKVVVERVPGKLASDFGGRMSITKTTAVVKDVLKTLVDLEKMHLYHNDIRSWNIILDDKGGAWVIDYGLVGTRQVDDDMVSLLWVAYGLLQGERESYSVNKDALPKRAVFADTPLLGLYDAVKKGERSATKLAALL